jgi:hypothetical protein
MAVAATVRNERKMDKEFIGHKQGIPPRCELCHHDEHGEVTWASWWHPALNLYLCNEHSNAVPNRVHALSSQAYGGSEPREVR